MDKLRTIVVLVAASVVLSRGAEASNILFAHVDTSSSYSPNGTELANFLRAAGHSVTEADLRTSTISNLSLYSQVWVYDLSSLADTSPTQMQNYLNIGNWYKNLATQNVIADARIISSTDFWTDQGGDASESAWIQNYAAVLAPAGGGLVLGTDHFSFHSGINNINAAIGLALFNGLSYAGPDQEALVAPGSALYMPGLPACNDDEDTFPTGQCVNANSSVGFAPYNLQPNGQILYPSAFVDPDSFGVVISTSLQPVAAVPEPTSMLLFGTGVAGLVARARDRRRREVIS